MKSQWSAGAVLLLASSIAAAAACPPDIAEPAGTGPYVGYRTAGELVFVSGQIGVDPAAAGTPPPLAEQLQTALGRLETVLSAAGSSPAEILRTTVFVADPADLGTMNAVYRAFFESRNLPLPARSLVPGLDFGNAIAVEVDAVARRLPCGPQ